MEEHLTLLSPLLTLWEWGFESIDIIERGLRRMRTWYEAISLCTAIFDLLFYHEIGILKCEAKFVFWRQWKLISVQNPMCHMAKQKNGSVILGKLVRYIHFFFYLFVHTACRILLPWPGLEPVPSAVKVQCLKHWTTREFPDSFLFYPITKSSDVEAGRLTTNTNS